MIDFLKILKVHLLILYYFLQIYNHISFCVFIYVINLKIFITLFFKSIIAKLEMIYLFAHLQILINI